EVISRSILAAPSVELQPGVWKAKAAVNRGRCRKKPPLPAVAKGPPLLPLHGRAAFLRESPPRLDFDQAHFNRAGMSSVACGWRSDVGTPLLFLLPQP